MSVSLANIPDYLRAQGVPHWVLVAEGFSLHSAEGEAWFTNVAQKHPVLKAVTKEEFQREITDIVLSAILEDHEDAITGAAISKDCYGTSCSVVPVLAGIVGDNLEQLRWLHCRKNHCHICHRDKAALGTPGWMDSDTLKHSNNLLFTIDDIRQEVIDPHTGCIKPGCKGKAEELCKKAGVYTSILHRSMAPIIRQRHCDAHQVVRFQDCQPCTWPCCKSVESSA